MSRERTRRDAKEYQLVHSGVISQRSARFERELRQLNSDIDELETLVRQRPEAYSAELIEEHRSTLTAEVERLRFGLDEFELDLTVRKIDLLT